MSALSPDRSGVPVWLMIAICLEQEDQQQTPVAAEKQRNAMRTRAFRDASVRSDRMLPLLTGQFPAQIEGMMALASMKWPFNVTVATRRRFYSRDRKGNGTIIGSARQPAESNLLDRILWQEPDHDAVARTLRNVRAIGSRKLSV